MESIVTVLRSSLPCVPTSNSTSGKFDAPAKSTTSGNLNDAVVNQAADALMAAAVVAEPEITALLQGVASANGGKLDGLDFKFKGKASMQRKVRKLVQSAEMKALEKHDDTPLDLVGIVWSVNDSVRYTMIVPTEKYTPAVKQAMASMEARGYAAEKLKNYWSSSDNYQGINDSYAVPCAASPSGKLLFELQFHTPESFAFKSDSHVLYETFRAARDPDAKKAAWDEQVRQAEAVPVPPGVLEIPEPSNYAMPGEIDMYAELALSRVMGLQDAMVARCAELVGAPPAPSLRSVPQLVAELKQLVATIDADGDDSPNDDGPELKVAVNIVPDALTLNFTFPESSYADDARAAANKLSGAFERNAAVALRNGWVDGAGGTLGLRLHLCVAGADDGVAFTDDSRIPFCVALHTPASLAAEDALDECCRAREAARNKADAKAADAKLAALRAKVPVPKGAAGLA